MAPISPAFVRGIFGDANCLLFQEDQATAANSVEEIAAVNFKECIGRNNRGNHFIKFDVVGISADGKTIELVDTKTKLAIWSKGSQQTVLRTLERTKEAITQNLGYKVVYEFDDEIAALNARLFLQKHNFHHYVKARVRKP